MTHDAEGPRHPDWLVETDWLEAHLDEPELRIFDCTMKLVPDPKTVYRDESTCIVNALARDQHTGESQVHYGRPGRIPSSVVVPAMELVDPATGAFRPWAELRALFEEAGALRADQVITYCGGGIAASADAFALAMLGCENVALYDASLSEWARDESLPMERG